MREGGWQRARFGAPVAYDLREGMTASGASEGIWETRRPYDGEYSPHPHRRGPRAFPVKTGSPEMLYLFDPAQFRTQNRFPLLLKLL
ncbi:hypothetical protein KL86PLE_10180 [uncultured Pleomorphomonas sp.]|uniref:Uncharacterized protein n=1 Tax=uncultured Pleomorphomonas sp. TaxID=442121 RepID=A0A212KZ08_9HYPH|nr:hypothetical protein KL86PLE_10180 [uncultured Pleomorphomonas sp.]